MRKLFHNGREIDIDAGRRAFIRNSGLAMAGLATFGAAGLPADPARAQAISDVDILNFALNLEYLEAEYYLRAAFGRGLEAGDTTGVGTQGTVRGGKRVRFDTRNFKEYAQEIARDEEAHVKFIRSALGGLAVAEPDINLKSSFTAAAQAAGLISPGETFDPFENETNFLLGAFIFEDVGVTAYKGAAPLISDKGVLEAAAGILAVEAYHAGEIRTILYQLGLFKPANAISNARDSLDGDADLDQGIRVDETLSGDGRANIVPADQNGIAFSRTPEQVLAIVYLDPVPDPDPSKVSFFPNGLNGAIR